MMTVSLTFLILSVFVLILSSAPLIQQELSHEYALQEKVSIRKNVEQLTREEIYELREALEKFEVRVHCVHVCCYDYKCLCVCSCILVFVHMYWFMYSCTSVCTYLMVCACSCRNILIFLGKY